MAFVEIFYAFCALIFRELSNNDSFIEKMYYFCGKKRNKMNREITDKIKKLRTAKGINQSEMARRLNMERSTYQKLEAGEGYSWQNI